MDRNTQQIEIAGARPDLLCCVEQNEGILVSGFEVKHLSSDLSQGMAQAHRYRAGVHHAYLALPGNPEQLERQAQSTARQLGVGLLVCDNNRWLELIAPADPTPLPWSVGETTVALEGVPIARQLQLNHPLNYLAVAYLATRGRPNVSLLAALETEWPDLASAGTREHAIRGAQTLHLIDRLGGPTAEGRAVADLLIALGFTPASRPSKRQRLADAAPAIAAVARFVFLLQPAVRLIQRALASNGGTLPLPELAAIAMRIDPPLGAALFLSDPAEVLQPLPTLGAAYNSSTVFKLKQNLWHAGILASKCHESAGGRSERYEPAKDIWKLDAQLPPRF